MLDILTLIAPIFGLILLGVAAAIRMRRPLDQLGWLNVFIIYCALPALFFNLISKTPVEQLSNWGFILTNVGVTFGVLIAVFALALAITRGRVAEATVQGLAAAYGNIGYMGPALAILSLGPEAAVPVALIFCFENALHFCFAPAMMAAGGRQRRAPLAIALGVLWQIATHPFMLATAAGVLAAVFALVPPAPVERLLTYLAQAAAPCALFAMGVSLGSRPLRRVPAALGYIVPAKLVLHPAAMYLALEAAGPFDPVWVSTAVLLAALPTATNVYVIASQYGVWAERASAAILATTTLSVVTVSALLYAIRSGAL